MRRLLFFLLMMSSGVAVMAGYRNPVLPGFHPDPSVCRVGDDYYLVNSTFHYFPGVPIYHSRDLVHWQQVGNVLSRASQLHLKEASAWTGIYAPTIRYHEGTYYLMTTLVGGGGNFLVTAHHPAGPWSDPVWVEQGGIDPSLYFEDGRCYMVSNPDNTITLCEIDPHTGRTLHAAQPLWQGSGGRWPEGPHLYKKDGYYYLLISEGGTELAHSLTMARSRHIYGPYEPCPHNPLFTHCSLSGQDSPIQGTGHGDLVQMADDSWWMVMLGYRPFNGSYHHLGRETFLAPVEWAEGEWPVVNGNRPLGLIMGADSVAEALPETKVYGSRPPARGWGAADGSLGMEWLYIQNPDSSKYVLRADGSLRLYGNVFELKDNRQPTFVGQRQTHAEFEADTHLTLFDGDSGDEAGLCVYQTHEGYAQVCVNNYKGDLRLKVRLQLKNIRSLLIDRSMGTLREVWLRVKSNGRYYNFYYSTDGKRWHWLESVHCSLMSTETVGGFTGATVGLYAYTGTGKYQMGYAMADFDYFSITNIH